MIHRWLIGMVIVAAQCLGPRLAGAADEPLPRQTPESQGVSSSAVQAFVEELSERFDGMHSVMVLRHGNVIAEGWWRPYDAEHNHVLYSLSKSFTSTALGMVIAEGKVSLDDPVVDLFPDDCPAEPSDHLRAMRVRDLLTMSTGHQDEPSAAADTVCAKTFLAHPVPHLPGTHFKYNTAATFMQSAIVQKVTGQTVLDFLRPRLFEPLGIEDPVWDANFQGISLGGYGLRLKTEDIAKFGQLYLQQGVWQGERLLPSDWVEQATSKQVSNGSNPESDWNQGYGFQFWRCRHGAYRGDGAFGQYCIVMPEQDAVVVITSGVRDMQAVLNVVWDELLPAFADEPLPGDAGALESLQKVLADLQVPPAEGQATSKIADSVWDAVFEFPKNEQGIERVSIEREPDGSGLVLTIEREGQTQRYPAGYRDWVASRGPLPTSARVSLADEPLASTFAWEDTTAVVKVCATETPFHWTFRLTFTGDQLSFAAEANVGFGPTHQETLVGQRR